MLKSNMAVMMKKAQQVQKDMQVAQNQLANVWVEGSAASGAIKVKLNCRNHVSKISINKRLLEDDFELLEDVLAAAINDGLRKAELAAKDVMAKIVPSGMMPPGVNLPF